MLTAMKEEAQKWMATKRLSTPILCCLHETRQCQVCLLNTSHGKTFPEKEVRIEEDSGGWLSKLRSTSNS